MVLPSHEPGALDQSVVIAAMPCAVGRVRTTPADSSQFPPNSRSIGWPVPAPRFGVKGGVNRYDDLQVSLQFRPKKDVTI